MQFTLSTECNNFGDIRLVDTSVQNNDDGTTDVAGVLEFCNDGTWNTVCMDSITPNDANRLCNQYGFNSKTILYTMLYSILCLTIDGSIVTDGSIIASDPGPYVNLSCPNYDYYRCSIGSSNVSEPCDYSVLSCFDGEGKDNVD